MSAAFKEFLRVLEHGVVAPAPDEKLLGPCPRCGSDELAVDLKTGLPWCDKCYLDALAVKS